MLADHACFGIVKNNKIDRFVGPAITKTPWGSIDNVTVPECPRVVNEIRGFGFVQRDDKCSRLYLVENLSVFGCRSEFIIILSGGYHLKGFE